MNGLKNYTTGNVHCVNMVAKVTCLALWEELRDVILPQLTEDMWEEVANEFWERTLFPNCIGALE